MSQSQDQSEFFRGTANVGTTFKDGKSVDGSSTIILIPFAKQVGFPNEKPLPIPPFSEFTFTDAKQVTDVIALIDRLENQDLPVGARCSFCSFNLRRG